MKTINTLLITTIFLASTISAAHSEEKTVQSLSGPRFGVSYLGPGSSRDFFQKNAKTSNTAFIQFGWQFETEFMSTENVSGLAEIIPLLGAFEYNDMVIPSLTALFGMRSKSGFEFGFGPFIGPSGTAVAVAFGYTKRLGGLNLPLNLAVVNNQGGVAISLLMGFNAVDNTK